ncbi:MAG TPA: nitrilase-related carbon-nitrogen hydrolase [Verrucomicrobiae bacterium]|nr:nitrilase-related carbon-nitrogen hydrolase [Verrucomicrobiae bacterium]
MTNDPNIHVELIAKQERGAHAASPPEGGDWRAAPSPSPSETSGDPDSESGLGRGQGHRSAMSLPLGQCQNAPAPDPSFKNSLSHSGLRSPLKTGPAVLLALAAAISFHLAYAWAVCSFMISVYLYCLFELTRLNSGRQAFYGGLVIGLLVFAPQLSFFWTIFGPAAIALWLILAFWIAMFLSVARLVRLRLGPIALALLSPFLWTGLEYFRSELYYLRFSWLNVGFAFGSGPNLLPNRSLGVYGIGFAIMACVGLASLLRRRTRIWSGIALLISLEILEFSPSGTRWEGLKPRGEITVAGIQLEFPTETEVIASLNQLAHDNPVRLIVLSEYTFDGPVPDGIRAWCRKHNRYLVVGGKAPAPGNDFYDTAFVIGPDGTTVFEQGKKVPIQFFKDGLPAREQHLWESPWGKIGICICYDLSYSRVTDELVRLGAQALIVPTMDVADWGKRQHELHARVAPVRAAEYGIPIFRVASSGISQCVDARGNVVVSAPFPGSGATIIGFLNLSGEGALPWDRIIAPLSVFVTGILLAGFTTASVRKRFYRLT